MFGTPNPDDFHSSSESKMDESLAVKFFYKERQDKAKTAEAGRPIFKEVEHIDIRVPGKRDPQACRPATHADKQRFPRHYDAFKRRVELPEVGTPLAEWPKITRSQVEELSFLGVKTVENLINISDTNLGNFMGGHDLKRKAKAWLELADADAVTAERDTLLSEVAELKAQMAELLSTKSKPKLASVEPTALDEVEEPKATPARRRRK